MDLPSVSNESHEVHDELEEFREKWQKELKISSVKHTNDSSEKIYAEKESDIENEARKLFSKGADMENQGKHYEAIRLYKKAMHLVPDIEYKIHLSSRTPQEEKVELKNHGPKHKDTFSASDAEKYKNCDILTVIQNKMSNASTTCVPKYEQKSTHFSSLPIEIIFYILRWVVSADLDLRSLEMFGQVCRGFYLCSRDSKIWRLACLKIWGVNCEKSIENFASWRTMFLNRARVLFNGCYISETTYIRPGEVSFQDVSSKPWHFVRYFRYFRFFPNGKVLMLTTATEPSKCLSLLRYQHSRSPVLCGYFQMVDSLIEIIIHRPKNPTVHNNKQNANMELHIASEQIIHMKFHVMNHRKRKNVNLQWSHYSIKTKSKIGEENICVFDLDNRKFTPLWFSRVKSYTNESENVLN